MLTKILGMPSWPLILIIFESIGILIIFKSSKKEQRLNNILGIGLMIIGGGFSLIFWFLNVSIQKLLAAVIIILCNCILIIFGSIGMIHLAKWLSNKN